MKYVAHFLSSFAVMIRFLKTHHLKPKYRNRLLFLVVILPVCFGAIVAGQHLEKPAPTASGFRAAATPKKNKKTLNKPASKVPPSVPKTIDWKAPSQKQPYPDLTQHPNVSLDVSLKKQRVFIKDGDKTLYTMYASTGIDNTTPHGNFAIQNERGYEFFNPNEQMGAYYYTSFYLHGTYLFHTVPTDVNGNYIASEAAKLGRKPGSHGCIRLSIPDAKWIFENIPTETPVKVY